MVKFTIRRILQAIPTIIGISMISMAIMILAPGNPASQLTANFQDMTLKQKDAMIEAMGVNAPIHVQYIRWMIGDAPITFGPVGLNLITVDTCRKDVRNPDPDHVPLPECTEVTHIGRIRLEDGVVYVADNPLELNGVAREIAGSEIEFIDGTIQYDGTSLHINGEELNQNNLDLQVKENVLSIRGREVEADEELTIINNEIYARDENVLTNTGELVLINGQPLSTSTQIVHGNGGFGLKFVDGQFTWQDDPLEVPDGFFTVDAEGNIFLADGTETDRKDDLLIVDGRLLQYNGETVIEDDVFFDRLDLIYKPEEGKAFNIEGRELPIDAPIYLVTYDDLQFENGEAFFVNEAGEKVNITLDGDIVTLEPQIIVIRGRVIAPDDRLILINDELIGYNNGIIAAGSVLVLLDGNLVYDHAKVITGTTIWDGQITLWEGREMPVFDGEGNILGREIGTGTAMGILRGDFGQSLVSKRSVSEVLNEKLPATIELGLISLVVGVLIGIPIGVLAAVYQGSWFDQFTRVSAVLISAIPVFWLGLILLLIFGVWLDLLPMGGRFPISTSGEYTLGERLSHLVLPVFTLSSFTIATFSRFMRASLLDVLNQDYIRTARAKGLGNRRTWFVHGMRNALIPIATLLGPSITGIVGGAVLTETIYSWPGMGRFVVEAVTQQDYPIIMATTLLFSVAAVVGFLLSDLMYAALDPRIRLS